MLWLDIQKDWKVIGKRFAKKWTMLTDADIAAIAGKRDELVKRLVKHYGTEKAKMEKEVDAFVKTLEAVKS